MDRKYISSFILVCASFIVFGFSMTILGAVLPEIIDGFKWSYTAAGTVFAAGSVSYFFSTFISGILIRKIPLKALLSGGLLLVSVPLFFFGAVPSFVFHVFLNFCVGFGHGAVEVVANFTVSNMEEKGENRRMSLLHAAFASGAFVGPIISGIILRSEGTWQLAFRIIGAATLLTGLYALAVPLQRVPVPGKSEKIRHAVSSIKEKFLVVCTVTLLVYVGVEIGVSNWISEFFVRVGGGDKASGSLMVSLFWGGLLAGRLLLPAAFRKIRLTTQLIISGAVLVFAILFTVFVRDRVLLGFTVGISGLGCSLIYPSIMSIVGHHYKKDKNIPLAVISTAGGIGAFAFPFIMSGIAYGFGLVAGFLFFTAGAAVMLLGSFGIARSERNEQKQE